MSTEPYQQPAEPSEKQLCIRCLTPNPPSANFCVKCGTPLGPYAFTNPFESNFAQGSSFRQAAEHPRNFLVVLGVWLIFGLMAMTGLFVIRLSQSSQDAAVMLKIFGDLVGLALVAFSGTMIWKTTRNYLATKKADKKGNA